MQSRNPRWRGRNLRVDSWPWTNMSNRVFVPWVQVTFFGGKLRPAPRAMNYLGGFIELHFSILLHEIRSWRHPYERKIYALATTTWRGKVCKWPLPLSTAGKARPQSLKFRGVRSKYICRSILTMRDAPAKINRVSWLIGGTSPDWSTRGKNSSSAKGYNEDGKMRILPMTLKLVRIS